MHYYSVKGLSLLVMRVMVSGIFYIAGINHLLFTRKIAERISGATFQDFALFFGPPEPLIIISGVFMLIGAGALTFGFMTRWAALGLLLIVIPITITIQVGQWATAGPLFKNVAISGGLLFFVLNGCVCCGLDQFINKPQNNNYDYNESD